MSGDTAYARRHAEFRPLATLTMIACFACGGRSALDLGEREPDAAVSQRDAGGERTPAKDAAQDARCEPAKRGNWSIERIAENPFVFGEAAGTSLVSTPDLYVHVVFATQYVTNQGGKWQEESIGGGGYPFLRARAASDAVGVLHVLWYESHWSYAFRANARRGAMWERYFHRDIGHFYSIEQAQGFALDRHGILHFAFGDHRSMSHWRFRAEQPFKPIEAQPETILERGVDALSLAVDSVGRSHIVCLVPDDAAESGELIYATDASGAWIVTTIDRVGTISGNTPIALAASEEVHIAYTLDDGLHYSENRAGIWHDQWVARAGIGVDITQDASSVPQVVFVDVDSGALRWATSSRGSWNSEVIDPEGGEGFAIAIDRQGLSHVSYVRGPDVYYAKRVADGDSDCGTAP